MQPPRHVRAEAMILLLALLGGGLGLPLFDVVAYHSRPAACRPLGPTLAEQGGVRAHPQVCVLPNATAASGAFRSSLPHFSHPQRGPQKPVHR